MSFDQLSIRRATIHDLEILTELGATTFYESFAAFNTPENMAKYLKERFNVPQITKEFNTRHTVFFLVFGDDTPIGYVKMRHNDEVNYLIEEKHLELERIYVKKAAQGQRIGELLIETCTNHARHEDCKYLWLGVWEENKRAIAFYEREGFVIFGTHPYILGEEEQTDFLMKKAV